MNAMWCFESYNNKYADFTNVIVQPAPYWEVGWGKVKWGAGWTPYVPYILVENEKRQAHECFLTHVLAHGYHMFCRYLFFYQDRTDEVYMLPKN